MDNSSGKYQAVIGLEVHVELATQSKMFCGCAANHFGKEPNTQTCPVCLGLPGALPVPNKKAVEMTMMLGLALNCEVNQESKFDRKNYFYPDLPKGYQISQYDQPLCLSGKIKLKNGKEIGIRRVHLEEDTGKLLHTEVNGEKYTLIDFNRSGVPLAEVVTEPDFETLEEVDEFLKKLRLIIRYLGVSDADMEKGSMRLEPSISLKKPGEKNLPDYRVELKNINSFRFVKKALEYEIKRQAEILEKGGELTQQTRGWSEAKSATVLQREKEDVHDYRYFPEPDIPPMAFGQDQISNIKNQIPELPDKKMTRFMERYGLSLYQANLLVEAKGIADYFEQCLTFKVKQLITPGVVANWIINKKADIAKTSPNELLKLIREKQQTVVLNETELEAAVQKVIKENPQAVANYQAGKTQAVMFLVGQSIKKLNGKGEPSLVKEKILSLLASLK